MDDSTMKETVELPVGGMSCESCVERIRSILSKVPGIENLTVEIGRIHFEYYPEAISLHSIRDQVKSLGYIIPAAAPDGNPFKRFLVRMIENNEKAFGSQRLDCCTMKKR